MSLWRPTEISVSCQTKHYCYFEPESDKLGHEQFKKRDMNSDTDMSFLKNLYSNFDLSFSSFKFIFEFISKFVSKFVFKFVFTFTKSNQFILKIIDYDNGVPTVLSLVEGNSSSGIFIGQRSSLLSLRESLKRYKYLKNYPKNYVLHCTAILSP